MTYNADQTHQRIEEVRANYTRIATGSGSGSVGKTSSFALDTPIGNLRSVQAQCLTPCPPGSVQLFKDTDNNWYAHSQASSEQETVISQNRRLKGDQGTAQVSALFMFGGLENISGDVGVTHEMIGSFALRTNRSSQLIKFTNFYPFSPPADRSPVAHHEYLSATEIVIQIQFPSDRPVDFSSATYPVTKFIQPTIAPDVLAENYDRIHSSFDLYTYRLRNNRIVELEVTNTGFTSYDIQYSASWTAAKNVLWNRTNTLLNTDPPAYLNANLDQFGATSISQGKRVNIIRPESKNINALRYFLTRPQAFTVSGADSSTLKIDPAQFDPRYANPGDARYSLDFLIDDRPDPLNFQDDNGLYTRRVYLTNARSNVFYPGIFSLWIGAYSVRAAV